MVWHIQLFAPVQIVKSAHLEPIEPLQFQNVNIQLEDAGAGPCFHPECHFRAQLRNIRSLPNSVPLEGPGRGRHST